MKYDKINKQAQLDYKKGKLIKINQKIKYLNNQEILISMKYEEGLFEILTGATTNFLVSVGLSGCVCIIITLATLTISTDVNTASEITISFPPAVVPISWISSDVLIVAGFGMWELKNKIKYSNKKKLHQIRKQLYELEKEREVLKQDINALEKGWRVLNE